MDFFGITLYGPPNYLRDIMKKEYREPMSKNDLEPLMQKVLEHSTCSKNVGTKIQRPDISVIRIIDCYLGRVNGFAYGSFQRFNKMKLKGIVKPVGPADMYRLPPTTSINFGWWQYDPALTNQTWYITDPRYPQPSSPNTRILDKVKINNKYASLF